MTLQKSLIQVARDSEHPDLSVICDEIRYDLKLQNIIFLDP